MISSTFQKRTIEKLVDCLVHEKWLAKDFGLTHGSIELIHGSIFTLSKVVLHKIYGKQKEN